MAAGANSNQRQKNTLAQRGERAAWRNPERGSKASPVGGASGSTGKANRRPGTLGKGSGGGGGTWSKSDYTAVPASNRKARKRKA